MTLDGKDRLALLPKMGKALVCSSLVRALESECRAREQRQVLGLPSPLPARKCPNA